MFINDQVKFVNDHVNKKKKLFYQISWSKLLCSKYFCKSFLEQDAITEKIFRIHIFITVTWLISPIYCRFIPQINNIFHVSKSLPVLAFSFFLFLPSPYVYTCIYGTYAVDIFFNVFSHALQLDAMLHNYNISTK